MLIPLSNIFTLGGLNVGDIYSFGKSPYNKVNNGGDGRNATLATFSFPIRFAFDLANNYTLVIVLHKIFVL